MFKYLLFDVLFFLFFFVSQSAFATEIKYTVFSDSNANSVELDKTYALSEGGYASGGVVIGNDGDSVSSSVDIHGQNNDEVTIQTQVVDANNIPLQTTFISIGSFSVSSRKLNTASIRTYANALENKATIDASGEANGVTVNASNVQSSGETKAYSTMCHFTAEGRALKEDIPTANINSPCLQAG